MIRPKLHHVTFKTSRLDEMIAWYETVIGVKVQFRDHSAAWTTNDEANHRIAFLAAPGLSDDEQKTRHNGMHHCAFEYGSFDDLMASFDRLRKCSQLVERKWSLFPTNGCETLHKKSSSCRPNRLAYVSTISLD